MSPPPAAQAATLPAAGANGAPLTIQRMGAVLAQARKRELALARRFRECRGLTDDQIEEIHQETVLALLRRPHASEQHLIGALRVGGKRRALKAHRDTRRRKAILRGHAPGVWRLAETRQEEQTPDADALAAHERATVREFLALLEPLEGAVFVTCAEEGISYRAAATALGIDELAARRAARAVEGKRARFQRVLEGRLAGTSTPLRTTARPDAQDEHLRQESAPRAHTMRSAREARSAEKRQGRSRGHRHRAPSRDRERHRARTSRE